MNMMLDSHSVPSPCMECAREGLTCCYYRNDTVTELVLPISYIECKNICSYLGITSIHTCFEEEEVTEAFQKSIKGMFPEEESKVEAIFPIGTKRYRFALRGSIKHCIFLTHKGCLLPRSVRPVLCNLFPFWIYQNGGISLFGNCKLAPQNISTLECIQKSSTSITELYALYNLLRMLWGF